MNVYNDRFSDIDDVVREFSILKSDLDEVEILYAKYYGEDYEGDAWVLFRKDGVLYEVNGSHCSCYGLEGQWIPELSSAKAILMRTNLSDEVRNLVQSL